MKTQTILANIELLKAMDTVVKYMNDLRGKEEWEMYGITDPTDMTELIVTAENDKYMHMTCEAFRDAMEFAEGGWYTYWDDREVGTTYGQGGK